MNSGILTVLRLSRYRIALRFNKNMVRDKDILHLTNKLKKYQELKHSLEFYENKLINLKSISYNEIRGYTDKSQQQLEYIQRIKRIKLKMKKIDNFIEKNFDGLPRLILQSRYIYNDSYNEIAKIIDCSSSTIRKKEKQALDEFIDKLKNRVKIEQN